MFKPKSKILFWITFVLIMAGQALLVWALIQSNTKLLDIFSWAIGVFLPFALYLFDQLKKRSLQWFLWSNRLKSFFSTQPSVWNMSVSIRSETIDENVIDNIIDRLNDTAKINRVTKLDKHTRLIEIKSAPTLRIEYYPSTADAIFEAGNKTVPSVLVSIHNYRVGYRVAANIIKREVAPLLEKIVDTIANADPRYRLTIEFDKANNPFFGLFISQLPENSVSRFSIQLNIRSYGAGNKVSVSESRLDIDTRAQSAFNDLAVEFLTFGSELEDHLEIV